MCHQDWHSLRVSVNTRRVTPLNAASQAYNPSEVDARPQFSRQLLRALLAAGVPAAQKQEQGSCCIRESKLRSGTPSDAALYSCWRKGGSVNDSESRQYCCRSHPSRRLRELSLDDQRQSRSPQHGCEQASLTQCEQSTQSKFRAHAWQDLSQRAPGLARHGVGDSSH